MEIVFVEMNKELTSIEVDYLVDLIITWIKREYNK